MIHKFNSSQKLYLISLILTLIFIFAGQTTPLKAQAGYELHQVSFEGNQTFSGGKLMQQCAMYTINFIQDKFLGKDPFLYDEEILNTDLRRIERFYQRQGFLYAKAEKQALDINEDDQSVELTIKIDEGKAFAVDSIYYNFRQADSSEISRIEDVYENSRGNFEMREGMRFQDQLVKSDQSMLLKKYNNNGFPYARIETNLELDTQNYLVDITYQIESGQLSYFGDVDISGTGFTAKWVIRRHLAFERGQIFEQKLLDETQRNLFSLGSFQIVTVSAVLDKEPNDSIKVNIKVKEAPRFSSKVGVGYGREDDFRAFSDSRLLDFLGAARRLNLYLKHSGLEPYHISLKLTQPSFLTTSTFFTFNPFIRRQKEPGYKVRRLGGETSVIHHFNSKLSGSVTYSFERIDLNTASVAVDIDSLQTNDDLYDKSGFILAFNFDNATPRFNPNSGFANALRMRFNGIGFSDDFSYTKALLDLRRYQKFWGLILALRFEIGGIEPVRGNSFIPVEDRFYAGGASSVRGWARAELGPLDENGTPRGGNSIIEGSSEIRYPIYGPLSGVVFMDFGNVWIRSFSYDINELRYASGLGLRYSTPIGPVRLDLARPVFDDEDKIILHISVGHAF